MYQKPLTYNDEFRFFSLMSGSPSITSACGHFHRLDDLRNPLEGTSARGREECETSMCVQSFSMVPLSGTRESLVLFTCHMLEHVITNLLEEQ